MWGTLASRRWAGRGWQRPQSDAGAAMAVCVARKSAGKRRPWPIILALLAAVAGCSLRNARERFSDELMHYQQLMQQTVFEDAAYNAPVATATALEPVTIDDAAPPQYWKGAFPNGVTSRYV